jgi:hypothetical protein
MRRAEAPPEDGQPKADPSEALWWIRLQLNALNELNFSD